MCVVEEFGWGTCGAFRRFVGKYPSEPAGLPVVSMISLSLRNSRIGPSFSSLSVTLAWRKSKSFAEQKPLAMVGRV